MGAEMITWTTSHGDTVEVYQSDDPCRSSGCLATDHASWRYRVRARNQKIVEQGSEGYTRKTAAIQAAKRHHPRQEPASESKPLQCTCGLVHGQPPPYPPPALHAPGCPIRTLVSEGPIQ